VNYRVDEWHLSNPTLGGVLWAHLFSTSKLNAIVVSTASSRIAATGYKTAAKRGQAELAPFRHRPRHPRLPLRRRVGELIAEGLAGYFVEGNAG
jgi:hypothetical protein